MPNIRTMIVRFINRPQIILYCSDKDNAIFQKQNVLNAEKNQFEMKKVYYEERPTIIHLDISQYDEEIEHDQISYNWTFSTGQYQGRMATIGVRTDLKHETILIFTQLIRDLYLVVRFYGNACSSD